MAAITVSGAFSANLIRLSIHHIIGVVEHKMCDLMHALIRYI